LLASITRCRAWRHGPSPRCISACRVRASDAGAARAGYGGAAGDGILASRLAQEGHEMAPEHTKEHPIAEPRLPARAADRQVHVGDVRTHCLEAGEGEPLVLIHSGEFGGRAELSWRYNIAALAERFHVYAPDVVGFGRSSKLYHFTDAGRYRVEHIRRFMDALCIDSAQFMGNSFGGSLTLPLAAHHPPRSPPGSTA